MQKDDEEDEEPGEEGETGEGDEGTGGESRTFNTFTWLLLINRVSDRTKINWNDVWDLNVYTFFNYLQFDVEYRKREEAEIAKWKTTH